jgi:hypothetical protein
MSRLRGKLTYSNVISTFCLVLLLGGGTAYAAAHLGKESVGARQLRKEAVTPAKLSAAVKATLAGSQGATGAAGPIGPQGLQGQKGDAGERGPRGPAGPTAAFASGGGEPPPIGGPHSGVLFNPTLTLNTSTAGRLFVMATVHAGASCPAGTYNCDFDVGLFLDGLPIPGTYGHSLLTPNSFAFETYELSGIVSEVAAGPHEVTVGWNGDSPNPSSLTSTDSASHIAAITLGGP